MTSNQHGSYALGDTRATMGPTESLQYCKVELISKTASKFGLKAAIRLHEAGIASNPTSATVG